MAVNTVRLLLPGSLPSDRATLAALCDGLAPASLPRELAATLARATVATATGSWSDAERGQCNNDDASTDLPDALYLLHRLPPSAPSALVGARTIAIASPLSAVLGLTDLTPLDPATLQLSEEDSRALCAACDQHLAPDGVRLHFVDPLRWLAVIDAPTRASTERPDWLIGESLRPNLPRGSDARRVERWMNELQMLLYTDPVNVAREDRGLTPVNVVWLWAFSSVPSVGGEPVEREAGVVVIDDFMRTLRAGDLRAWQGAWQRHATTIMSAREIVLGDARPRLILQPRKAGILDAALARFRRAATLAATLESLRLRCHLASAA